VQVDTARAAGDGKLTGAAGKERTGNEWLDGLLAQTNPQECGADIPLGYSPFPEIQPYYLDQVRTCCFSRTAGVSFGSVWGLGSVIAPPDHA